MAFFTASGTYSLGGASLVAENRTMWLASSRLTGGTPRDCRQRQDSTHRRIHEQALNLIHTSGRRLQLPGPVFTDHVAMYCVSPRDQQVCCAVQIRAVLRLWTAVWCGVHHRL